MLDATEKEASLLREEIARKDSVAGGLSAALERNREQYAAMVREAYRNYRHNNYLTYIFSSRDFADAARRIANLRAVASMRESKLRDIRSPPNRCGPNRRSWGAASCRSIRRRGGSRRSANGCNSTRATPGPASAGSRRRRKRPCNARSRRNSSSTRPSANCANSPKATKEGASFSSKTSGLRLPVQGGRVKRYKGNMAEVAGPKGAQAISIYDGKVVEIKRNRITGKYDVFVAHGEYITSYANLGTICVEKGQKVARNEALGTIGSAVDIETMQTEYRLVFGIYPPDPKQTMSAANCFKK